MVKKDTIDTTPSTESPTAAPADASARSPSLTVSNSPCSLRNRNFPTSSISTKTISKSTNDNEVTFYYPPAPDAFSAVYLKTFDLSPGSTVSNSPYSLINRNFHTTSTTTKNKLQLMIKLLSTIPLSLNIFPLFPQRLMPDPLDRQSPTPHIH